MKQKTLAQTRKANLLILKHETDSDITTLGLKAGIPRPVMSDLLKEKKPISDLYARRIENGFGRSLGWLDFPQGVDGLKYEKEILQASIAFIESNIVIKEFYDSLNVSAKADYLDRLLYIFEDKEARKLPSALILKIMGVTDAVKQKDNSATD